MFACSCQIRPTKRYSMLNAGISSGNCEPPIVPVTRRENECSCRFCLPFFLSVSPLIEVVMSVEPVDHSDDSTLLPDNLLQYYNEIVNLVKTDCTFPSIGVVENDPTIQQASNQPSSNLTNRISPESSLPFPSSTSEQLGNTVALGNPSAFAPTVGDLSQSTMNPYELFSTFHSKYVFL